MDKQEALHVLLCMAHCGLKNIGCDECPATAQERVNQCDCWNDKLVAKAVKVLAEVQL